MKNTHAMQSRLYKSSRRQFLKSGLITTGGLMIGAQLSCTDTNRFLTGNPDTVFKPNIWLDINGLGDVTIVTHRSEMGTGIRSTLPMVMADELEADWSRVKLVQAEGDEKYGDQNTDGSYSIRMFYEPMRKAAAAIRLMLERTAAAEWA
ncbi:MAG: molybdopterin-dependent oxidoreductase, partial [Saprospiraceae bacterium]|nr:molybdopterin-dependent oxidoreductase [Saprospiraceae bacterium]